MKILLFSTSLSGGGAQRILQLLSNYLVALGHETTIASLDRGIPAYPFSKKARIVHFKTGLFNKGFLKILFLPLQTLELLLLIKKVRPDATISFLVRANLVNALSKAFKSNRAIVLSHRNITQGLYGNAVQKDRIMLLLIQKLYRRADRIIAISRDVKTSLGLIGVDRRKIKVIPNFIDWRIIEQSTGPTFQIPRDKPVILSMGRLIEQKDFPTLLRAFAIVKSQLDARLVIIGEGPQREQLTGLAGRLQIAEDVLFAGWLDNPFKAMRHASVFVLCSRYEGFGNVIIEAMACGLPVICTHCPGGPDEILKNGTFGKLVGIGDVNGIAESILEVLRNQAVREKMRQQSLIRAKAYTIENLAPKYLSVIAACLNPAKVCPLG
jgi:glycosyltransferase involved in cell wall biosynthesis